MLASVYYDVNILGFARGSRTGLAEVWISALWRVYGHFSDLIAAWRPKKRPILRVFFHNRYKIEFALVGVVVVGTVGTEEGVIFSSAGFNQFRGVLIVAAGALDGVEVGQSGGDPLGDGFWQDPAALTAGTGGVNPLEDRLADEIGLVRQGVEDLRQMLVHAKRYDGLLLLSHDLSDG